jgi:hypothetical protein
MEMADVLYGPMHLVVVGFENLDFHSQIWAGNQRVRKAGLVLVLSSPLDGT